MEKRDTGRKNVLFFLAGFLGCLCFGGGDWLMIYGDTANQGTLYWLTEGAARIPAWRNGLAMAIAFPGIACYGICLFHIGSFLKGKREQKRYRILTVYSLTPWLCLHLFYVMILYLFAWMHGNGCGEAAAPACEALYAHLSWLVPVSEIVMLPPFLYLFYVFIRGGSIFAKKYAFANPLVIYVVLYLIKSLMPDGPFRLAFTNGLMSESMAVWFAVLLVLSEKAPGRLPKP